MDSNPLPVLAGGKKEAENSLLKSIICFVILVKILKYEIGLTVDLV